MGDDPFASLPAMGHFTARPKLERAASSRQLHHATGYEPVIREYEGENSMSLLRRTAVVLGTFGLLAFAGCAGVATEGANIANPLGDPHAGSKTEIESFTANHLED